MRIQQLPPAIANQIAAGEVIERPASVVKELLENALDAGATEIMIEVGYGGLNQIKISDNGSGIVAEDLPLAIAAHATSKITTFDDLYAIDSMGFRGEALASIASIAKVSISSRTAQQDHAMCLSVQGSEINLSPCARSEGTTIDVVDLFFNAPVRKCFLKSEKLEFQAIEQVVKRFSLSAPHIGLSLKHNHKLVLSLPPALNEQARQIRMARIFGQAFVEEAIFLEVEQGSLGLYGWLSGLKYQRSQNDRQWIYINQRMVKDKLILHALRQTYEGLLHPGRFPGCLLYFTIKTDEVDVNVHPTKHEVRFHQPRLIHDFFTHHLTEALHSVQQTANKSIPEQASQEFEICEPYPQLELIDLRQKVINKTVPNHRSVSPTHSVETAHWIVLNQQHCLLLIHNQPYLVNVVLLYQKWLFQQLLESKFPLDRRPLLVAVRYPIPDNLKDKKDELAHHLDHLGILLEFEENDSLLIRSVPISLPYLDLRLFLDDLNHLNFFTEPLVLEALCQAQYFDPKLLSTEEREALNQLLFSTENNEYSMTKLFKKITDEDCRMLLNA